MTHLRRFLTSSVLASGVLAGCVSAPAAPPAAAPPAAAPPVADPATAPGPASPTDGAAPSPAASASKPAPSGVGTRSGDLGDLPTQDPPPTSSTSTSTTTSTTTSTATTSTSTSDAGATTQDQVIATIALSGRASVLGVGMAGAQVVARLPGTLDELADTAAAADGTFTLAVPATYAGRVVELLAVGGGKTLATVAVLEKPASYRVQQASNVAIDLRTTLAYLTLADPVRLLGTLPPSGSVKFLDSFSTCVLTFGAVLGRTTDQEFFGSISSTLDRFGIGAISPFLTGKVVGYSTAQELAALQAANAEVETLVQTELPAPVTTIRLDKLAYIGPGDAIVEVSAPAVGADPLVAETLAVAVTSNEEPTGGTLTLQETAADSHVFRGTLAIRRRFADDGVPRASAPGQLLVYAEGRTTADAVRVAYGGLTKSATYVEPPSTVTGRVTVEGVARGGALVQLEGAFPARRVVSRSDGDYAFYGVPSGAHALTVTVNGAITATVPVVVP